MLPVWKKLELLLDLLVQLDITGSKQLVGRPVKVLHIEGLAAEKQKLAMIGDLLDGQRIIMLKEIDATWLRTNRHLPIDRRALEEWSDDVEYVRCVFFGTLSAVGINGIRDIVHRLEFLQTLLGSHDGKLLALLGNRSTGSLLMGIIGFAIIDLELRPLFFLDRHCESLSFLHSAPGGLLVSKQLGKHGLLSIGIGRVR